MSIARIATLRAELRDDTTLVATPTPRLTWTVATDSPGWVQASAELRAGDESVTLAGADSVLVAWPFAPLAPHESREVSMRAVSDGGVATDWSAPLAVEAAFLGEGEWAAEPIGLADPTRDAQPFRVRARFTLDSPVTRATLYWTALGVAEPEVNGAPVSDDVLAPGWTSYRDRLVHETVDVTALVQQGENVIGATVAGAWYTEKYGFFAFADRVYGDQPSFLAQLRLELGDGSVRTIATGSDWRADGDGPVVDSGIYAGEHQDLGRADAGWSASGYDDAHWAPVRVGAAAKPGYENVPVPEARIAPPVRRVETRQVEEVLDLADGRPDRRLRSESGRATPPPGQRPRRRQYHGAPCRGAGRGRTGPAPAAQLRIHRHVRPRRGPRGDSRVPLHVPRVPVRADRRLAG